ncbi:hypothetical protein SAMN05192535_3842 [Shouchella rhizosphaerae]|nr:hypothetical protein SAMN05192535_3842 [Shouchella rhizosphaerae]
MNGGQRKVRAPVYSLSRQGSFGGFLASIVD